MLGRKVVERQQLLDVVADLGERCWFHKISNVLAAMPKSAHPGAKKALAEIWNAEDKSHARDAVKEFESTYGAKFPKAVCSRVSGNTSRNALQNPSAVPGGQHRGAHAAAAAITQQIGPRLGGLEVTVGERDQLLAAVRAHPDHHQAE
jgi:hypothetical protein